MDDVRFRVDTAAGPTNSFPTLTFFRNPSPEVAHHRMTVHIQLSEKLLANDAYQTDELTSLLTEEDFISVSPCEETPGMTHPPPSQISQTAVQRRLDTWHARYPRSLALLRARWDVSADPLPANLLQLTLDKLWGTLDTEDAILSAYRTALLSDASQEHLPCSAPARSLLAHLSDPDPVFSLWLSESPLFADPPSHRLLASVKYGIFPFGLWAVSTLLPHGRDEGLVSPSTR